MSILKRFTALMFLLIPSLALAASNVYTLIEKTDEPLPFKEAFFFTADVDKDEVKVTISTRDGYYIYKDFTEFTLSNGEAYDIKWDKVTIKDDPYNGITPIVEGRATVTMKATGNQIQTLEVFTQGCQEKGLCYMPETYEFELNFDSALPETAPVITDNKEIDPPEKKFSIWGYLLLGFLIALTPCVFPMFPIVLGALGKRKVLSALAYTQGLAITFVTIGTATTLGGSLVSAYINNIYVYALISLTYIWFGYTLLADKNLSFGTALSAKFDAIRQRTRSELLNAFLVGVASGILATPCTAGALLAVYTSLALEGNITQTVTSLYATALGLSAPLIGIALFSNQILTKPGPWMVKAKLVLGTGITLYPTVLLAPFSYTVAAAYLMIAAVTIAILLKGEGKFMLLVMMLMLPFFGSEVANKYQDSLYSSSTYQDRTDITGLQILKAEAAWCTTCQKNKEIMSKFDQTRWNIIALDLTTVEGSEEELIKELKILGLPSTFILNDGAIQDRFDGEFSEIELVNWLERNNFTAQKVSE